MESTQDPASLYGAHVIDSAGKDIGSVDGVWMDDATKQLEFISVQTGLAMGKSHLVPVQGAETRTGQIQLPYDENRVKNAPAFGTDAELAPADEDEIYGYYGIERSTSPSPTGLGTGAGDADYRTATSETDQARMQISEEQLQVGKRRVETGRTRLRKVVRTEQVQQPVELKREEVEIERVAATGGKVPDSAFQEREIEVPLTREEPVVEKTAQVTGEVRVNKRVDTETRTVGGEIRKEEVEVDEDPAS